MKWCFWEVLGFSNTWYRRAFKHREGRQLNDTTQIQTVSAPYFLITKLEAFKGRGKGDYLESHDVEDIIAVLDGRAEILEEVTNADTELREELSRRFKQLIQDQSFLDAISGHMRPDQTSQARVPKVTAVIRRISEL